MQLTGKYGLLKTYFLPLISAFTPINTELRKISNDRMTTKMLIINTLSGHWSLGIFAITLSLVVLRDFKHGIDRFIKNSHAWLTRITISNYARL